MDGDVPVPHALGAFTFPIIVGLHAGRLELTFLVTLFNSEESSWNLLEHMTIINYAPVPGSKN